MPFVPGIAMTNAVRDLMNNHLNSWMSKLFETLLITLPLVPERPSLLSLWNRIMNLIEFLIQAVASLIAIITFLIVLNVQRLMLVPGGVLEMAIWLLYYILKGPTNVIIATFIALIVSLYQSNLVLSIRHLSLSLCWLFLLPLGSWIYFLSDHLLLC